MRLPFFALLLLVVFARCNRRAAPTTTTPTLQLPKAPEVAIESDTLPAVQTAPAATAPYRLLRLTRTPCYGKCPHYTVDIYSNGLTLFDGKRHAPYEGLQEAQLPTATLEALRNRIAAADFFQLAAHYPPKPLPDLPAVQLEVSSPNRTTHTVRVQHAPPVELAALVAYLDELVAETAFSAVR